MSQLGRRYAEAFLDAAPPGYDVEAFLGNAAGLARALAEGMARAFFAAPAVPARSKENALRRLAEKTGVDPYGQRFLGVVLGHRRILRLPEILEDVRERLDRRRGVVAARVTVASPIGEAEKKHIGESLERRLGGRVRMDVDVDPAILGGFVARVGSDVFDASVAQAIEQFRREAKRDVEA